MEDYVLLKGEISGKWYDFDKTAHYHIIAEAMGKKYDIAINIGSVIKMQGENKFRTSKLLVFHDESYNHRILDKIVNKKYGIHKVEADFALDYVNMKLFDVKKMKLMPALDTKEIYLAEILEKYVLCSLQENIYDIYVYGMFYEDGSGIHDVHMNQGSGQRYRSYDRSQSDGALFLHNKKDLSWAALFLAFKDQKLKK